MTHLTGLKLPTSFPGGGGGGTQLCFGGCVPCGFQNVGSRERIFLKKWGSLERKFWKFWVKRARILAKTWLKCKNFLKIENRGHKSGALTVNWWARERRLAWKKGSWPWHIPIPLSKVSAPRHLLYLNYQKP